MMISTDKIDQSPKDGGVVSHHLKSNKYQTFRNMLILLHVFGLGVLTQRTSMLDLKAMIGDTSSATRSTVREAAAPAFDTNNETTKVVEDEDKSTSILNEIQGEKMATFTDEEKQVIMKKLDEILKVTRSQKSMAEVMENIEARTISGAKGNLRMISTDAAVAGTAPVTSIPTNVNGDVPPPASVPAVETASTRQEEEEEVSNNHKNSSTTTIPIKNMSVLVYKACCGLGHRLSRMAGAYEAAHRLGFRFEANWGICGKDTPIFEALFRPETPAELEAYVSSTSQKYTVNNEVNGFHGYGGSKEQKKSCDDPEDVQSRYNFYSSLKQRFRGHDKVERFVRENFHDKLAMGIHIRDGNGEKGDFVNKGRGLKVTPQEYADRVSRHIIDFLQRVQQNATSAEPLPRPVLFVASDNAQYAGLFRSRLAASNITVVEWSQEREAAGSGVSFQSAEEADAETCVQKWSNQLMDMMLLASTHVLIAGQYSEFSQGMPLSLVLGSKQAEKEQAQKIPGLPKTFCELYSDASEFACYEDAMQWCATTRNNNGQKTLNELGGTDDSKSWKEFLDKMYASPHYLNDTSNM